MTTTNTAEIREASRRLSAADHAGMIRSFYPYWDTQYRPYLLLELARTDDRSLAPTETPS